MSFMSEYYNVIGVSSSEDRNKSGENLLNTIGVNEAVKVFPIEMTRQITPLKDLKATYELYKLFKSENPHIVHTHTPKAGTLGMLAAYLANVPHRLHTIAGLPLLEAEGFKRFILNMVEKITYACATKVYPNSNGLKEIVLKLGFTNESKLKVLGQGSSNGVDIERFDPSLFSEQSKYELRTSLKIKEHDFVCLFIGRLVSDKGLNELLAAFNKISSETDQIKLIFVGSREKNLDPLSAESEKIIEHNQQIICLGTQKDVRPYLSIANVLTFPSYREGFPNVVMEAGAMGVPCIVTNINGCNEIIIEGINGFIIPVKNQNALYDAIQRVFNDRTKKLLFNSNKTRNLICNRYSRKEMWNTILAEYNSL